MRERIEKYIRKKKCKAILKALIDNSLLILGVLALILVLIVLKILKKKTKKKLKTKVKASVKDGISKIRTKDESSDGEEKAQ